MLFANDATLSSHTEAGLQELVNCLSHVWTNSQLTRNTKQSVYRACVVSTLLVWQRVLDYKHCSREAVRLRYLRRMLQIRWQDRVTNAEVLHRASISSLFALLSMRRLR